MTYIETLMLTVIVFMLCIATITDIKKGVVPNRLLVISGLLGGILDIVYYIWFYRAGFSLFVSDVLSISVLAILFYALEIWAAGDSKLLITVSIGIPSRLYSFLPLKFCPLFVLVMIVFSIEIIYTAGETLIRSLREKRHFWKEINTHFSLKTVLYIGLTIFFMVCAVLLCNIALSFLLNNTGGNNTILILAVDFICTLVLIDIRKKISTKTVVIASTVMLIITTVLFILGRFELSFGKGSIWAIIIMLITIVVRMLSGKYNYQEISVDSLANNMVLSMATSLKLNMTYSFEEPLPVTENRNARLTPEQVIRIQKAMKKDDCSTLVIVRKIPFAIFIFIGTLLFLGLEAVFAWFI